MDYEKLILPPFLIAELYKGTLVDLATPGEGSHQQKPPVVAIEPEQIIASANEITFLGDNKKGVIILINSPEIAFLSDRDLTFLTNILKACNLNLADIAIINHAKKNFDYAAIKEQLKPRHIFLFDVDPSAIKLPFLIPPFQPQNFDGCIVMVAPPLSLLNQEGAQGKILKTRLWLTLKQIFNI